MTLQNQILKDYIGEDYGKVPYLYSNLFAKENPNIQSWIEKDEVGNIKAVFLLYHTCLHLFSRQNRYEGTLLSEILRRNPIDVVMVPGNNEELLAMFPSGKWDHVTDYIERHEKKSLIPDYEDYLLTSEEEIAEVAYLLMQESLYSVSYSVDSLQAQLMERWNAGYGKIFGYKKDGRIVGCLAVTGENDSFIFYGCLMVEKGYRRQGIADFLVKCCVSYACEKNKHCLCFIGVDNKASLAMHEQCNSPTVIGKIIKCYKKRQAHG